MQNQMSTMDLISCRKH